MTATVIITQAGFAEADAALAKIESFRPAPLLEGIARMIQIQTRRRIEDEKTGPNGEKWPPNSAGTPILYREGHLSRSIDYLVTGTQIAVGSGLIYARIHQEGGKIVAKGAKALSFMIGNALMQVQSVMMPARPYLGLSGENRTEIIDEVVAYVRRLIG